MVSHIQDPGMPELVVPAPGLVESYACFSIYDAKAARYSPPEASPNEDVAVRRFGDLVSAPGSIYHAHSSDFDLFYCGEWHPDSCVFEPVTRRHVVNGTQCKAKESNGS